MINRICFGLTVALAFVSGLIIPVDAVAGRVYAKTTIAGVCISAFWETWKADWDGNKWGDAECFVHRGRTSAYAHEWWTAATPSTPCLHNWVSVSNGRNCWGWAHAWHAGSSPYTSSEASLACYVDTLIPQLIPGDSATAESFQIWYMDATQDSFDIHIDSASFLQVYLGDVDPGDSTRVEWKLDINGEVSRVRLVGYVLPGGGDSVVTSMDGRFVGLPYTLTLFPNRVHVLSFGHLHFTAAGNVAESDLLISSGDEPPQTDIPTLTEWGLIIFGVVLLGFISWVFLRKRKTALSLR
jgi:hypothetical protein